MAQWGGGEEERGQPTGEVRQGDHRENEDGRLGARCHEVDGHEERLRENADAQRVFGPRQRCGNIPPKLDGDAFWKQLGSEDDVPNAGGDQEKATTACVRKTGLTQFWPNKEPCSCILLIRDCYLNLPERSWTTTDVIGISGAEEVTLTRVERASAPGLRVALFTDSYTELNGVGTLCREYVEYARKRGLPFFCAYGGEVTEFRSNGSVQELELRRGPLSFPVDTHVECDPILTRHRALTVKRLKEFRPDLVHITGPGDVSIFGFWASNLVGVPMVASWHTNVHEYAELRVRSSMRFLPMGMRARMSDGAGWGTLWAVMRFYQIAHFVAAPNLEMVAMLQAKTGRPAFLMGHGVNTELFTPRHRDAVGSKFSIGYVGRLTPEKNVSALVAMERELLAAGERDFRFVVVGEGSEMGYLRENLQTAEFRGVLRGEALAREFANLDAFVFPSVTDTFGLVILEAMSSGVPVVLSPATGTKVGAVDGEQGFLTDDPVAALRRLMHGGATRERMGVAGRVHACAQAWDGVFDDLHRIYREGLANEQVKRRTPVRKF